MGTNLQEATQVIKSGMMGNKGNTGGSEVATDSSMALMRALTGSVVEVTDAYFPPDIVGGVCPRIPGEEESIVWNAAAEACDSERIHVVWQAAGNSIWYLAVKSSDLSSHPGSWCPLAAFLPTPETVGELPSCYTYFGEELALLMVITSDELHIFRGTAPIIKAKADRIVLEHGEKTRVSNIDLYRIGQMAPIPWYSVSLFEERARRVLSALSVVASLAVIIVALFIWLSASVAMISAKSEMEDAKARIEAKTKTLMNRIEETRASPLRDDLKRFLEINDELLSVNGFLTVYSVKDRIVRWKATVPLSATGERISRMGGKHMSVSEKGVVIGNDAQIDFEKKSRERR